MVAPISLSNVRKAKALVKKRQQADENAVKFGRSKAVKSVEAAAKAQAARALDGHKRDDGYE